MSPNGLTIKEVTLDDGGLYVCRAMQSNPMISDFKEMNITLKIRRNNFLSSFPILNNYLNINNTLN